MKLALENPPWVNAVLDKHWSALLDKAGPELMPVPSVETPRKRQFSEFGCGHYGCVLPVVKPGVVLKVTSDPTEAAFIVAAMQIGEWPDGIVRYHGIFETASTYRNRSVFFLWREEAHNIGGLLRYGDEDRQQQLLRKRVWHRLSQFRDYAASARDRIKRAADPKRMLEEVSSWRERIEPPMQDVLYAESPYFSKGRIPAYMKGAQGAAFSILAAEIVAQEMENEDVGYLIDQALSFYLEHGILLADVHANNVGQVKREDYQRDPWVITDPGHMVALDPKWLELSVPAL